MTDVHPATVTQVDDECVVCLHGEVDLAVCEQILAVAVDAINACPADSTCIVIDLSDVTFLDSSGMGALVSIRGAARARGIPAVLRAIPDGVDRVLQVSGLATEFGSGEDRRAAAN